MADRKGARTDLHGLFGTLSRKEESTIHLVWAWFGAGKTHALRYFCHLCKNGPQKLTCVYTEFPKGVKSFVDLYRAFSFEMEIDSIKEAFTEILTSPSSEEYLKRLRSISQDFEKAGRALVLGTGEQPDYAMRWLRGENIPLKDLRTLGINARISSTEDALRVLRCIVFLEASAAKSQRRMGRLIWILDEFQVVADLRQTARDDITGSLHSLFNRVPANLTIFISFSGKPERKFPPWVSRELGDRIGIERVILLPPLTSMEALEFVRDLLAQFRPDSSSRPPGPFFPFDETAVHEVVEIIQHSKSELKPRRLMQCLNAALEEAEPQIADGKASIIDATLVRRCLEGRVFSD